MFEGLLVDFLVFYESDDRILTLTFGASKRIYLIEFWIRRAHFLRYALDDPSPLNSLSSAGSRMEKIMLKTIHHKNNMSC